MKKYDSLFFLVGSLAENEVPAALENIKTVLAGQGASEIAFDLKGRQKLAYPINAAHFAYLAESSFVLSSDKVKSLKEKLQLEPDITRFLITRHQAKAVWRRPLLEPGAVKPSAVETVEKEKVDLQEIDKKIDEILQQESIVI